MEASEANRLKALEDENARLKKLLAESVTGAHVMLVHHTGKDRNAGARGSYSITGNSDTVIELVPLDGDDKTVMAVLPAREAMLGRWPPAMQPAAVWSVSFGEVEIVAKVTSGKAAPEPRKGMPSPRLDETTFRARFRERFSDPAFERLAAQIEDLASIAWEAYSDHRKSPVTRKAGPDYADPDYDLSVDWIAARDAIRAAEDRYKEAGRARALVINASPRSEHTCPGEMSKSWRLAEISRAALEGEGIEVEILDLSRVTSEYGRHIHPCKACFSTAAPLCHWPCSCYPNHSLGQTQDWMNDIYPMWVAAHGVMIITPVNWYQVSAPLKLMMDRLVCADGGNPDPTLTGGKDAAKAKAVELAGWDYPRHLEGRLFSVVVHGDVEGAENVRRSVADWLRFMKLDPAGPLAEVDRYIGYWEPYATSHEALDNDAAMQGEVRNAALSLAEALVAQRAGKLPRIGASLTEPREK